MNLSCGNCKAIRSFSGEPPTCDTCGWVAAALQKGPAPDVGDKRRSYLEAYGKLPPKSNKGAEGWLVIVLLAAAGFFYFQGKDAGYIAQSRTMDVAMKTSWIVGEYKTCFKPLPSAGVPTPEILSCDDGADAHALKVEFYGDPDSKTTWSCQRKGDAEDKTTSLTCKAQ
jgi:hypothetical protein